MSFKTWCLCLASVIILGTVGWALWTVQKYLPYLGLLILGTVAIILVCVALSAPAALVWAWRWIALHLRGKKVNQDWLVLENSQWTLNRELPRHTTVFYGPQTVSVQPAPNAVPAALPAPTTQEGTPLPSAPPFREIAHLITAESIILSYTIHGPVYGEIGDLLSMALIGKPKRGKTTALLFYVCILLMCGADVWVWDPHGEMRVLAGLNYFDRYEDIARSVPRLKAELDERDKLYRQTKQVKHPLVLIVDEMPALADWENDQRKLKREIPSPYGVMKKFTLEARKWNGYVFISGQSLPAQVLPTLTRSNLSSRIILECEPGSARMMGLQKEAIDTLLPRLKGAERGTHIADFSSWSSPELADIPYTTEDDLRWVLQSRVSCDGNSVNGLETPLDEATSNVFPFPENGRETSTNSPNGVGNEIRETIRRMKKKGMIDRDIAPLVGLGGRKYGLYQQTLSEMGIDDDVVVESEA